MTAPTIDLKSITMPFLAKGWRERGGCLLDHRLISMTKTLYLTSRGPVECPPRLREGDPRSRADDGRQNCGPGKARTERAWVPEQISLEASRLLLRAQCDLKRVPANQAPVIPPSRPSLTPRARANAPMMRTKPKPALNARVRELRGGMHNVRFALHSTCRHIWLSWLFFFLPFFRRATRRV